MATTSAPSLSEPHRTHEVTNQSVPLTNYDVYAADTVLQEAVRREGAGWVEDRLHELGRIAGSEEAQRWGVEANENPPVLQTHDRYGHRIDEVAYHPSYHRLMEVSIGHALHALPWREPQPGAHVARSALFMSFRVDAGHGCPVSMTYSAVPALRKQPELAEEWEPRMLSLEYDQRLIRAEEKAGVTIGMAMTEKQGGSDVRANTTRARALNGGGAGAEYEVTGHKWFCSAPMCDAFLVLAQTDEGVSCFLMPRVLEDGTRNRFRLQRLKDKLGNRSNASSEVEFDGAWARMVGEPGRGVPTIIEMVNHTRLDCVVGSAAGMRTGTEQAIWHAKHRAAFGKLLADQPLMKNVLADLAIESEAATATAMRLARAYDESAAGDEEATRFKRLATAIGKYWTCKRWPVHAVEALESLGGAGYVEASGMPRLFRESPLNGIWEGSGNVISLDVLRALARDPHGLESVLAEIAQASGAEPRLDTWLEGLRDELTDPETMEMRARRIVEKLALALQASLLVRHAPPAVADAFVASRLGGDGGRAFGTLPAGIDFDSIIERHAPAVA